MELVVLNHNKEPTSVDDVILLICRQIKKAMNKPMRIFCITLLTRVSGISDTQVIQMMKKEDAVFK
jgi:hypothetical protein